MNNAILPIFHRNQSGVLRQDGCGFMVKKKRNLYFVTCAHTFDFHGNEEHLIVIDSTEYLINYGNPLVKIGNIEDVKTDAKIGSTNLVCFMPDYLLFRMVGFDDKLSYLKLRVAINVTLHEPLKLVTYNRESTQQAIINCHRPDLKNTVTLPEQKLKKYVERTNLMRLKIDGPKPQKGNSGGPILDQNGDCIGFLVTGGNGYISIFKAEDIPFE